jgi:uncharacterized membrane protein YuzA (DUF378 family)
MHELKKYLLMPLVLIGALNWGLVGFFNYDLVVAVLPNEQLIRIVYGLVGLAAVGIIFMMLIGKKK